MTIPRSGIYIRHTQPGDFPAIIELSKAVYPFPPYWNDTLLASHLEVFPEGQFVAADSARYAFLKILVTPAAR